MSKFKVELVSFVKTFLSVFFPILITTFVSLPVEVLTNFETYKTSFFLGLIVGAVRTTISLIWQQFPKKVGGLK